MKIPQLSISTVNASLAIESRRAQLSVEQPPFPQLNIETEELKLDIQSQAPKIEIDQTQAFAESGLMKPIALSETFAARANSRIIQTIGKIASQGTQLANIHKGSAIAQQALYNAYDQFEQSFGIVSMPKTPPEIKVIEGRVDINIQEAKVNNQTELQLPKTDFQPGSIDIYIAQKNQITISVIDLEV